MEIVRDIEESCIICRETDNFTDSSLRNLSKDEDKYIQLRYGQEEGSSVCQAHYMSEFKRDKTKKNKCSNPFGLASHGAVKYSRYPDSELLGDAGRLLDRGINYKTKLCTPCIASLQEEVDKAKQEPSSEEIVQSQYSNFSTGCDSEEMKEVEEMKQEEMIDEVEKISNSLNLPAIDRSKIKTDEKYKREVVGSISQELENKLNIKQEQDKTNEMVDEMVTNIKKKIEKEKNKERIIELLSILPEDWTYSHFKEVFNVSWRQVQKAKLFKFTGCHEPRKMRSDAIPDKDKEIIQNFYFEQGISRQLAGKKDFIRVPTSEDKTETLQKSVLLNSVAETYALFQQVKMESFSLTLPHFVSFNRITLKSSVD